MNVGKEKKTELDAVITSDIKLLDLDSEGENVKDENEYGGRDIIVA